MVFFFTRRVEQCETPGLNFSPVQVKLPVLLGSTRRSQTLSHPRLKFSFNLMLSVGRTSFRSQRESPSNRQSPRQPAPRGLRTRARTRPVSSLSRKLAVFLACRRGRKFLKRGQVLILPATSMNVIGCLSKCQAVTPGQKPVAGQLARCPSSPAQAFPYQGTTSRGRFRRRSGLPAVAQLPGHLPQWLSTSDKWLRVQRGNTGKRRQRGSSLALLQGVM